MVVCNSVAQGQKTKPVDKAAGGYSSSKSKLMINKGTY